MDDHGAFASHLPTSHMDNVGYGRESTGCCLFRFGSVPRSLQGPQPSFSAHAEQRAIRSSGRFIKRGSRTRHPLVGAASHHACPEASLNSSL